MSRKLLLGLQIISAKCCWPFNKCCGTGSTSPAPAQPNIPAPAPQNIVGNKLFVNDTTKDWPVLHQFTFDPLGKTLAEVMQNRSTESQSYTLGIDDSIIMIQINFANDYATIQKVVGRVISYADSFEDAKAHEDELVDFAYIAAGVNGVRLIPVVNQYLLFGKSNISMQERPVTTFMPLRQIHAQPLKDLLASERSESLIVEMKINGEPNMHVLVKIDPDTRNKAKLMRIKELESGDYILVEAVSLQDALDGNTDFKKLNDEIAAKSTLRDFVTYKQIINGEFRLNGVDSYLEVDRSYADSETGQSFLRITRFANVEVIHFYNSGTKDYYIRFRDRESL